MKNLPEFDWNDLRYFVAVAREGSTLAAARALGVSQPTVQRRLAALEKQIGCRLVEPLPSGYRLTDLGKELLPHAERVEQDILAFGRRLTALEGELAGTLRITCPEADVDRVLRSTFERFQAKYPGVRIEFLVTDRTIDLAKGEADIALRGGQPPDSILVGRKLADVPWRIYANRGYLERHGAPARPEDINNHAVVTYTGPIGELAPVKWMRTVAPNAKVAAYSSSVLGAASAAKSGLGLAILPAMLGGGTSELACAFRPQPELIEPFTALVHPDLREVPRVRALLDFLAAERASIQALFRDE